MSYNPDGNHPDNMAPRRTPAEARLLASAFFEAVPGDPPTLNLSPTDVKTLVALVLEYVTVAEAREAGAGVLFERLRDTEGG